jgi:PAS domain S-box-containing protein
LPESDPPDSVDVTLTDHTVIEAMARAVIVVDPDGRIVRWNGAASDVFGWTEAEVLGRRTDDILVPAHELDNAGAARARLRAGETVAGDFTLTHRDGRSLRVHVANRAVFGTDGQFLGVVGVSEDVSHQRRLEQESADLALERERAAEASVAAAEVERIARHRLEFLAEINDALATASSRREAMHNVTRATVPRLGEWCTLYVLPDTGSRLPDIDTAHSDPDALVAARDLQARFPYDPDADEMIPRVIRTGESEFYPVLADVLTDSATTSDEARAVVPAFALQSVIAVPLVRRDRILGAMQFVNSDSGRVYTDDDLVLAEVVASRIASSLDNLRLREHEQMIARTLQASLLPESLPHVDGVDVAVRYWATGEGTEVGGDFYDVFQVDDRTAVVMGDVCGTGPMAASTTGLARHTIRASAWHGATGDAVLSELNHAMLRSGRSTFCTVSYCTLAPTSAGFRFEVTSGGHPLPIVCRSDGTLETVGLPGTLVGMLDSVRVQPVTTVLHPGDTVVLYTDGVTDVRPPHDIDADVLARMVQHACERGGTADEIAEHLRERIEAVLPLALRNDDIAVLVLRITR